MERIAVKLGRMFIQRRGGGRHGKQSNRENQSKFLPYNRQQAVSENDAWIIFFYTQIEREAKKQKQIFSQYDYGFKII